MRKRKHEQEHEQEPVAPSSGGRGAPGSDGMASRREVLRTMGAAMLGIVAGCREPAAPSRAGVSPSSSVPVPVPSVDLATADARLLAEYASRRGARLPDGTPSPRSALLALWRNGVHQTVVADPASPSGFTCTRWGDVATDRVVFARTETLADGSANPLAGAPCLADGRITGEGLILSGSGLGTPGASAEGRSWGVVCATTAVGRATVLLLGDGLDDPGRLTMTFDTAVVDGAHTAFSALLHASTPIALGADAIPRLREAGQLCFLGVAAPAGGLDTTRHVAIHHGRLNRRYLEYFADGLVDTGRDRDVRLMVGSHESTEGVPLSALFVCDGDPNRAQVRALNDWGEATCGVIDADDGTDVFLARGDSYQSGWTERNIADLMAGIPDCRCMNRGLSARSVEGLRSAKPLLEWRLDLSRVRRLVINPQEWINTIVTDPATDIATYAAWCDELRALGPNVRVIVTDSPTTATSDRTSAVGRFNALIPTLVAKGHAAAYALWGQCAPNHDEYWNGGAPNKSLVYWIAPAHDPVQHPSEAGVHEFLTDPAYGTRQSLLTALRAK